MSTSECVFLSVLFLTCMLTSKIIVCNKTKAEKLHETNYPPCKACRIFVESFKKAVEIAQAESNSDDAAGKIKESVCSDVIDGRRQCYSFLEEFKDVLEEWWLDYQDKDRQLSDLFKYFCIETIKRCCPDFHYGADCTPCLGYPGKVCSNNGKCKGAGTRKGNGECKCDQGYAGEECDQCADAYYESYKDEDKLLCSKCHASCEANCTQSGPKGCESCANGWAMTKDKGCSDVNECAGLKPVCSPLQFCVNTEGSFQCLECDPSCEGCTGDGPDMCVNCANGFVFVENVCIDAEQESRRKHVFLTRYLTYFGLCVATCIIFQRNVILAAVIGLAVGIYISVSEYMLNTPPEPSSAEFAKSIHV